jgi:hypothetical protein
LYLVYARGVLLRTARVLAAGACFGLAAPAVVSAQPPPREPLPFYTLDVRGAFPLLGQSVDSAASLGVEPAQLPGRGLGVSAGLHVYPIRLKGWAIGFGGEWLRTRARQEVPPVAPATTGVTIARRLDSLSAHLSLNFGHRDGWSYLSGGLGPLAFDTWDDADEPDGVRATTLNYGGGGRWFTTPHLAFTFDVRFYATRPSEPTTIVAARAKQTVMVISVGISVR